MRAVLLNETPMLHRAPARYLHIITILVSQPRAAPGARQIPRNPQQLLPMFPSVGQTLLKVGPDLEPGSRSSIVSAFKAPDRSSFTLSAALSASRFLKFIFNGHSLPFQQGSACLRSLGHGTSTFGNYKEPLGENRWAITRVSRERSDRNPFPPRPAQDKSNAGLIVSRRTPYWTVALSACTLQTRVDLQNAGLS